MKFAVENIAANETNSLSQRMTARQSQGVGGGIARGDDACTLSQSILILMLQNRIPTNCTEEEGIPPTLSMNGVFNRDSERCTRRRLRVVNRPAE